MFMAVSLWWVLSTTKNMPTLQKVMCIQHKNRVLRKWNFLCEFRFDFIDDNYWSGSDGVKRILWVYLAWKRDCLVKDYGSFYSHSTDLIHYTWWEHVSAEEEKL